MRTVIINDTTGDCVIKKFGSARQVVSIRPREKFALSFDPNATYGEWDVSVGVRRVSIYPDDLVESAEIIVYERSLNREILWRVSKARVYEHQDSQGPSPPLSSNVEESYGFIDLIRDISSKLEAIDKSSARLAELSKQVKICSVQCKKLVNTCSNGVNETWKRYSALSQSFKWELYVGEELRLLGSYLDRLLFTLRSAEDLLLACGNEWWRMGLVVTIPLPAPEKKPLTKFYLILKELSWNLGMIYVAMRLSNATGGDTNPVEFENLASEDHVRFKSDMEDGSILKKAHLATVLTRRLEIPVLPVEGDPKLESALESFRIPHLEPKIKKSTGGTPIGEGAFKRVFKGEWCGMPVAISELVPGNDEIVKNEALLLLRLQHPNVVGFLGWGYFEPHLSTIAAKSNVLRDILCKESVGFLVMELMERDLKKEIDDLNKRHKIQSRLTGSKPECPFPLDVAVDILQQIVEAMVHMHNLNYVHRDLKALNCLVSRRFRVNPRAPVKWWSLERLEALVNRCSRVESSSQALAYSHDESFLYTVKLIDFGISKLTTPESRWNTPNCGTSSWMAPECWAEPGIRVARYDPKPADVFSFGMVCYEVITGKEPFEMPSKRKAAFEKEEYRGGREPLLPEILSIPEENCSEALKELMKKCWALKPSDRPSFRDIQVELCFITSGIC